jgi:hypothetical protein
MYLIQAAIGGILAPVGRCVAWVAAQLTVRECLCYIERIMRCVMVPAAMRGFRGWVMNDDSRVAARIWQQREWAR